MRRSTCLLKSHRACRTRPPGPSGSGWSTPTSATNLPHDGYLKLYQRDKPVLSGFDLIAVDEAQDLNPCTFDIVCRQSVPVVMVGDAARHLVFVQGFDQRADPLRGR